ncbi:tetratricopeptide repeat-containing serine protease family protein [Pelatocladus sp. BLCC-F211]|uniref:tetratricopeptide repeat-containing S1 family peptidase n=1 Tax=Pelatocladus sp. BLCC-F211 TaxID=3342752 RepID=UPI0035B70152
MLLLQTKCGTAYEIITPDGKSNDVSDVKPVAGKIDLAIVKFASNRQYRIATIGNSDKIATGNQVYVYGFPIATTTTKRRLGQFTEGKIAANASKALPGGYTLQYDNQTQKGMEGSPVLNENAELIGIHTKNDTLEQQVPENREVAILTTTQNYAIPINTFVQQSKTVGIALDISAPTPTVVTTNPKADDFYIQAGYKYKKGDFKGAIADYTEAIRLNPQLVNAYTDRGVVRAELGDNQGAIADYNQALRIDSIYYAAYHNRGYARAELGDKQGAIDDFNQALRLNPNLAETYNARGRTRADLGDKQGALDDYNQTLRITPNYFRAYSNRGIVRFQLGDKQGGIEDFNQALRINPKYAKGYYNRGYAFFQLQDWQKAIADFNKELQINPKHADAYVYRSIARLELKVDTPLAKAEGILGSQTRR